MIKAFLTILLAFSMAETAIAACTTADITKLARAQTSDGQPLLTDSELNRICSVSEKSIRPVLMLGYAGGGSAVAGFDYLIQGGPDWDSLERLGAEQCEKVGGTVVDYRKVTDAAGGAYSAQICAISQ